MPHSESHSQSHACPHQRRGRRTCIFRSSLQCIKGTFLLVIISDNIHLRSLCESRLQLFNGRILFGNAYIIDIKSCQLDSVFLQYRLHPRFHEFRQLIQICINFQDADLFMYQIGGNRILYLCYVQTSEIFDNIHLSECRKGPYQFNQKFF